MWRVDGEKWMAGTWAPVNVIIMLLQTSADGNTTTSVLSFMATKADAGRHLSCQAENRIMGTAPIEDGWVLQIQCKLINGDGPESGCVPRGATDALSLFIQTPGIRSILTVYRRSWFADTPETQIQLGTSLNPNTIREGTDVYFDCLIQAEPSVYKVEWRHQVSESTVLFRMKLIQNKCRFTMTFEYLILLNIPEFNVSIQILNNLSNNYKIQLYWNETR